MIDISIKVKESPARNKFAHNFHCLSGQNIFSQKHSFGGLHYQIKMPVITKTIFNKKRFFTKSLVLLVQKNKSGD